MHLQNEFTAERSVMGQAVAAQLFRRFLPAGQRKACPSEEGAAQRSQIRQHNEHRLLLGEPVKNRCQVEQGQLSACPPAPAHTNAASASSRCRPPPAIPPSSQVSRFPLAISPVRDARPVSRRGSREARSRIRRWMAFRKSTAASNPAAARVPRKGGVTPGIVARQRIRGFALHPGHSARFATGTREVSRQKPDDLDAPLRKTKATHHPATARLFPRPSSNASTPSSTSAVGWPETFSNKVAISAPKRYREGDISASAKA